MTPAEINPAWFLLTFAIFWLAICGGLAFASGWRDLAKRYQSDAPLDGERIRFASGAIGSGYFPVGYRNCLSATVGRQGFELSMLWLFRFLHPRLVIPWSAVESCEPAKLWFRKYAAVNVAGFDRRILFAGSLGEKISEGWAQARK